MSLAKLYSVMESGHPDDNLVKVVVPSQQFIWLWIPKNAGGSISRTLVQVHGGNAIACDLPLESLWKLNPEMRDFRIVGVKRNPFTRIVSCWLNKIADPKGFNPRHLRKYPNLRQGMSFPDFAEWLTTPEGRDRNADPHWQSQYLQLERATEVLAFEELPWAVSGLGIKPRELSHRNQHGEAAETAGLDDRPLADWYDERAAQHIRQRYGADFWRLGYDQNADPASLMAS